MMTVLQRLSSLALALVFSLLLGGCSWGVWDFLRDKDKVRPDDLVNFDEEVRMRRNWSISVGDGEGKRYNRLKPALAGDRLFVSRSMEKSLQYPLTAVAESGAPSWTMSR